MITHVEIWHAHHPLHQVVPTGVEPFVSLDLFNQQIEQLGFGGCVGHALEFPSRHVSSASGKADSHTSPPQGGDVWLHGDFSLI